MVCRHDKNDPSCSSHPHYVSQYGYETETIKNEPDSKDFEIITFSEIGKLLIVKVQYPSCKKCSYEGNKILVYSGVSIKDIVFWKEIDPHFKDPKIKVSKKQAPPPIARFPASESGWNDALEFAKMKKHVL